MGRLTWIEHDHGWRAGPYEIELAAPELWVCSRRSRRRKAEIVLTSGSLSALKERIDRAEVRRRRLRRFLAYLAAVALSMALMAAVLILKAPFAALSILVLSAIALFSALKAIDCLIERSWETLRLTYQ